MKHRLTIVLAALLILAVAAAAWLLQKVPVPGASPETAAELEALGLDPAAFAMYPEDALVYIARQLQDCEFLHLRAAGGSALGSQDYRLAVIVFVATAAVSGLGVLLYRAIQKRHSRQSAPPPEDPSA